MCVGIEDDARFPGRAPQAHAEMEYQVFA